MDLNGQLMVEMACFSHLDATDGGNDGVVVKAQWCCRRVAGGLRRPRGVEGAGEVASDGAVAGSRGRRK